MLVVDGRVLGVRGFQRHDLCGMFVRRVTQQLLNVVLFGVVCFALATSSRALPMA
jgi:hypothetical protein